MDEARQMALELDDEIDPKLEAEFLLLDLPNKLLNLFTSAFASIGAYEVKKVDWLQGCITINYGVTAVVSDDFRHAIQGVYGRVWGGKPKGLEIVYKQIIEPIGPVVEAYIQYDRRRLIVLLDGCCYEHELEFYKPYESMPLNRPIQKEKLVRFNKDPDPMSTGVDIFQVGIFKV